MARPGARGEPPDSDTAATAAEPALQILEGKAMLHFPCLELRDINRIGQSPRRLVSKFWPPRVTQHVDNVLPAVLVHHYHQTLLQPDVAAAQAQADGGPQGATASCELP
jgi:hypothetical protein